ncbi:type II toxin-antitoxin system Phd/YefM family antitoxin [Novosphingobium sp. MMS21-SN21R]|uniref:type II toxin-antitoxin system Phd/YefM family antitoxin n=1 Tax=Novosphingobium sp. MMS21-SN21R TaxID=2969298 RepID=UPI002887DDE5|nr:type II toxin-antitoxin system Phd/YefM family antitoxin [Novosphingobium sp. MMS21-SN21R]MDT0509961.1 type II toxin-antitoxin system Phd/YefM family antitoxin [Novosphingobium sp. MMS21-SN21R]
MGLETRIKPISYLKAHSAEVIRELNEGAPPLIITQNGEAKAVLQDAASYYQMQETMALLKLLALAKDSIAAGNVHPAEGMADRIRARAAAELAGK